MNNFSKQRLGVVVVAGVGAGLAPDGRHRRLQPSTEPPTPPIAVEEFTRIDAEHPRARHLHRRRHGDDHIDREAWIRWPRHRRPSPRRRRSIHVQPGVQLPWHTHNGPVIVTVIQGELVYVMAEDCHRAAIYRPAARSSIPAAATSTRGTTRPTAIPSSSPRSSKCRPTDHFDHRRDHRTGRQLRPRNPRPADPPTRSPRTRSPPRRCGSRSIPRPTHQPDKTQGAAMTNVTNHRIRFAIVAALAAAPRARRSDRRAVSDRTADADGDQRKQRFDHRERRAAERQTRTRDTHLRTPRERPRSWMSMTVTLPNGDGRPAWLDPGHRRVPRQPHRPEHPILVRSRRRLRASVPVGGNRHLTSSRRSSPWPTRSPPRRYTTRRRRVRSPTVTTAGWNSN